MMRLVLLAAAARFFASTTAIAHRIAVPSAAATVQLSTLDGTLEIRGRDGQVLRGQTSGFSTTPCRAVTEGELRLRCSSGRLDAALERVGDRAYLDLRELRGLPAGSGDEALPRFVYAPDRLGLGAACPGSNPPSRGECLMQAGQTELAKQELERAAQSEFTRPFAMVRLGDLALAESGPDAAVSPWASAAGPTPFGRVAAARLC
jgi:hypothetical protein